MTDIEVILHANVLRVGDKYYVPLPNLKARIMWLLARKPGGIVPMTTMIEHCWEPDNEPIDPLRRLNQEIQELRDILAPLGFAIKCRRQFGYWLVPLAARKEAA